MSAYAALEARFRRLGLLGGAAAMLHWDWATMMPPGGAGPRAAQLAELALIRHETLTDAAVCDLLDEAESETDTLDAWQRANLARMWRRWREAAALPGDLVQALSEASSQCEMVWREARPASDFPAFADAFAPLLGLAREKAAALGAALDCAPYDGLIESYEPGLRAATIDPLFDDLAGFLPEFLGRVRETQAGWGAPPPLGAATEAQQALARRLMAALGFDFDHGRLDISLHPFCGGSAGDIRITTRYDEADALSGLMGVLHETGHALYEAGLPEAWRYQPVGQAGGMALHESQSLLIEMQACRSRPFMRFLAPLLGEHLGGGGGAADAEALYRRAIRVEPGYIRVDADEVTYPAHIMLRYRLERALIAGDLAVGEIPGAWAEIHESLLGLRPENDTQGCLQDIHWSVGEIGYFPSYTIGALMAAQFFDAAARDEPDLWPAIERGDFAPLLGWLRANVHALASRHQGPALLERATGAPLGTAVFKAHLQRRYLG
ncbi:MAG: carboxypeptidase M32 [Rhodospirillales bacterium]|nr:carboxypeptidase M32 [Rhodospirillales bacterium]MDE0379757.1 carboxypeptidase M32 [Rhodospirillales bacterium]